MGLSTETTHTISDAPPQHAPIVGMGHRLGGRAVLSQLPTGARLRLEREPLNPYDEMAIRVLVRMDSVPEELRGSLDMLLLGHGLTYDELAAAEWFHLGYIANNEKTGGEWARAWAPAIDQEQKQTDGPKAVMGLLAFDVKGRPEAVLTKWPETEPEGRAKTMPHDERTRIALEGSIAKWQAIVDGTGTDQGGTNCPLCVEFIHNVPCNTECEGCPVMEKTGLRHCDGTPYFNEWWPVTSYVEPGSSIPGRVASTPEQIAAAQAELDFLIGLRDKAPGT